MNIQPGNSPITPIKSQLFTWVTMQGAYHPPAGPAIPGDRCRRRRLLPDSGPSPAKATAANFVNINVLDPAGRKAAFATWCRALARAICIHQDSLELFSHARLRARRELPRRGARSGESDRQPEHAGRGASRGSCCRSPAPGACSFLTHTDGGQLTAPVTLNATS